MRPNQASGVEKVTNFKLLSKKYFALKPSRLFVYLNIFGNMFMIYFVFGKVFNSLWHNLYAFGPFFIDVNVQILKTQSVHLVTLPVASKTF